MVSITPRPLYPVKDAVPIVQEAGWATGPVWTGAENLAPIVIRSPDRPARSRSLRFSITTQILKLTRIRPVGAPRRRADRQTDMTKLTVTFSNFENTKKIGLCAQVAQKKRCMISRDSNAIVLAVIILYSPQQQHLQILITVLRHELNKLLIIRAK
jgi:hypothetical protein